ncbi:MAG: hypothetical protein ACK58T_32970, partial [Phycisphaerae bacterium]
VGQYYRLIGNKPYYCVFLDGQGEPRAMAICIVKARFWKVAILACVGGPIGDPALWAGLPDAMRRAMGLNLVYLRFRCDAATSPSTASKSPGTARANEPRATGSSGTGLVAEASPSRHAKSAAEPDNTALISIIACVSPTAAATAAAMRMTSALVTAMSVRAIRAAAARPPTRTRTFDGDEISSSTHAPPIVVKAKVSSTSLGTSWSTPRGAEPGGDVRPPADTSMAPSNTDHATPPRPSVEAKS